MPTVNTVRGPVDVDELGQTLMHEHVFVLSTEYLENYGEGAWWDEEFRVADAIAKLTAAGGARACGRSSTRRCGGSAATSPASSGSPPRCPT